VTATALTRDQVRRLEASVHADGPFVCPLCRHTGPGALFVNLAPLALPVWDTDATTRKPGGYAVVSARRTRCRATRFSDAQGLGLRFD